jgi:hypothetical protein
MYRYHPRTLLMLMLMLMLMPPSLIKQLTKMSIPYSSFGSSQHVTRDTRDTSKVCHGKVGSFLRSRRRYNPTSLNGVDLRVCGTSQRHSNSLCGTEGNAVQTHRMNTDTAIQLVSLQFFSSSVILLRRILGAALLTEKRDSLVIHIR